MGMQWCTVTIRLSTSCPIVEGSLALPKKSMTKHSLYPQLSEEEGLAHIASYLRSGLRPSEYYRRHNLSEYQFYKWYRRYRSVHPELSERKAKYPLEEKQFHEVKFEKESLGVSLPEGIEIHYPHGVKVVIPAGSGWSADTLSLLIKLWE
jgi:transposase-like protein